MTKGPLRRLIATVGLIALAPVGVLLVRDQLTVPEAAVRGALTFVAVLVVAFIARKGVAAIADSVERQPRVTEPLIERRSQD